jgi:hypothetical protein
VRTKDVKNFFMVGCPKPTVSILAIFAALFYETTVDHLFTTGACKQCHAAATGRRSRHGRYHR